MSLAKANGGIPALTAVFVVMTGVFGAVIVTPLMNALRIRDYAARGFAAGLAAHGIGTARAFQVDPLAGAFAGIALGLNGGPHGARDAAGAAGAAALVRVRALTRAGLAIRQGRASRS